MIRTLPGEMQVVLPGFPVLLFSASVLSISAQLTKSSLSSFCSAHTRAYMHSGSQGLPFSHEYNAQSTQQEQSELFDKLRV